ncbi:MAG TPA: ABC transporter permease [Clostridia bacterium]|nr:ABC transporter permease [Clostridia bacterium]
MKLSLEIAFRFLKANKAQTILIIIGIAIGVSVQIFIGSLIQGLQKDLVEKTVGSSQHITVLPDKNDSGISDYITKEEKAKKIEGVKYVTSSVDKNAFLNTDSDSYPILVRGINNPNEIYKIYDRIIEGERPKNENEILIGIDLKKEIECKVGDLYEITTPMGTKKEFKISGIFDVKILSLNKLWVIADFSTVQNMFDLKGKVTSIDIQVKDVFEADKIATKFENDETYKGLIIQNWKIQNEQLLSGLSGQSISSIMIQVFVMVSVVLGISSVLAISVSQKSKQIGILKAMGINNKKASMIFLFQGVILGKLGALLGIIFGLGLAYSFTKFAVNPDGTPVIALYIDWTFIILSGIIAIIASSIASIIPAVNSSKLEPMEVIRNG